MRGIIPVGLHRSGVRSYREGRQVETADMLSRPIPASMPQSSLMEERPGFRDYWAARTGAVDPAAAPPSIRAEEQTWFTPAQKLWGAGLVTGIGGIVDARGKYPVPPGDEATVPEMLRSERMPGMVEHYKTGHPVIGTLQGLGLLPLVGYAKAASGPVRTALGVEKVAAKTPAPTGIAAIPMTRRKFLEKAGIAGAGIAALGAGIGRATKGAKTKAAAAAGRVGAKVGQLTHRADIHKFHDWVVNDMAHPTIVERGLEDNPLSMTSDRAFWGTPLDDNPLRLTLRPVTDDLVARRRGFISTIGSEEMVPVLNRYGLDAGDFHLLDDQGDDFFRAQALTGVKPKEVIPGAYVDAPGDKNIWGWNETGDTSGKISRPDISLFEHHGVPVFKDEAGRVFVPNEVGLQKLELHQMKQVMGDDLPDWMEEGARSMAREQEVFHNSPGEYLEDAFNNLTDTEKLSIPGIAGRYPDDPAGITGGDALIWPALENFYSIPLAK